MQYLLIYSLAVADRVEAYSFFADSLEKMDEQANKLLIEHGESISIVHALKVAETYDYKRIEGFTR